MILITICCSELGDAWSSDPSSEPELPAWSPVSSMKWMAESSSLAVRLRVMVVIEMVVVKILLVVGDDGVLCIVDLADCGVPLTGSFSQQL